MTPLTASQMAEFRPVSAPKLLEPSVPPGTLVKPTASPSRLSKRKIVSVASNPAQTGPYRTLSLLKFVLSCTSTVGASLLMYARRTLVAG